MVEIEACAESVDPDEEGPVEQEQIIIFEGLGMGWVVDEQTLREIGIYHLKKEFLADLPCNIQRDLKAGSCR